MGSKSEKKAKVSFVHIVPDGNRCPIPHFQRTTHILHAAVSSPGRCRSCESERIEEASSGSRSGGGIAAGEEGEESKQKGDCAEVDANCTHCCDAFQRRPHPVVEDITQ